jgi:menaquinone-9 beta-reductase
VRTHDVVIVGGGPAGAAAAGELVRGGADVLVLDRDEFPRLKLCAGWITPEVVRDLEMTPASYPHRFLTFERLRIRVKGMPVKFGSVQHSIRRWEFDAWLLERSGAPVVQHMVRDIRRDNGDFVLDDEIRCRWLVGAGGTNCPVYRTLFRDTSPRCRELQMVALEHELPWDWTDPDCHLWFFEGGLPGYAWYVPKADGWLNLGIGGVAHRMKGDARSIRDHWSSFARRIEADLAPGIELDPSGHSYYLRGPVDRVHEGRAFLVGDAAGLATRDMGEGIGPAIRSGRRAARSILEDAPYHLDDVTGTSIGHNLPSRLLDWALTRGAGRGGTDTSPLKRLQRLG